MRYRDTHGALSELYSVANAQGGYFTAKQAARAGYNAPHLTYHVGSGNFERVMHGLFRLPRVPVHEHDDLIRLSLWSRDRRDRPQGVFSHVTALVLHELSEIIPRKVHVTVPSTFRKEAPSGCVLHRAAISPGEIIDRGEFRFTSAIRTIVDLARSGEASREQIMKSVGQGIERGLLMETEVKKAIKTDPSIRWIVAQQSKSKRKKRV